MSTGEVLEACGTLGINGKYKQEKKFLLASLNWALNMNGKNETLI